MNSLTQPPARGRDLRVMAAINEPYIEVGFWQMMKKRKPQSQNRKLGSYV
jgi:hypothetical protein